MRLNNTSQLAGFAKRDDLQYFLRELCGAEYHHEPALAPTEEILDAYKKKQISWEEYETRFVDLLIERAAENGRRPAAVRRAGRAVVQRAQPEVLPPPPGGRVSGRQVGRGGDCAFVKESGIGGQGAETSQVL